MIIYRAAASNILERHLAEAVTTPAAGVFSAIRRIVVPHESMRLYLLRRLPELAGGVLLNTEVIMLRMFFRNLARELLGLGDTITSPRSPTRGIDRTLVWYALRDLVVKSDIDWLSFRDIEAVFEPLLLELQQAGLTSDIALDILAGIQEFGLSTDLRDRLAQVIELYLRWLKRRGSADLMTATEICHDRLADLTSPGCRYLRSTHLYLFGFHKLTSREQDVFEALFRWCPASVYLIGDPHDEAFALTGRWVEERLGAHELRDLSMPVAPPPVAAWFNASGKMDEIREIAQRINLLLDQPHTVPHRIGVVFRKSGSYSAAVQRIFDEYHIPFVTQTRLPATFEPRIRALRLVFDCLEHDFPRTAVTDLVHMGRLQLEEPAATWRYELDLVARRLGVAGGDDWRRLLDDRFFRDGFPLPYAAEEEGGDSGTHVPKEAVLAFGRWMDARRSMNQEWPVESAWDDHADRLVRMTGDLIGFHPDENGSSPHAGDAGLMEELRRMRTILGGQGSVSRRRFLQHLKGVLGGGPGMGGADGIAVLDAEEAVGMSF
ncbi:hypothetical protein JW905_15525, partial [bacterium]|nr:hypothetical protein [candidate division CSSED10-310 bacterium]